MADFNVGEENDVSTSVAGVEDIDTDFSSYDEEEEEVERADKGSTSVAEQYRDIILKEEEEFEKITAFLIEEDDIEKKWLTYDYLFWYIYKNHVHNQDVTPMLVDGAPVLIDASSLVTCVMKDSNYCVDNGGQTLHFIYLCERIIELISRKGGTCEIVFFQDKSVILQAVPDLFLALSVLKIHLIKNTNVIVHEMNSIFSSEFKCYLDEVHPCFMMFDFNFIDVFREYLAEEKANHAEKLFHYYKLFALSVGLYCVDVCHIELQKNMLYSFVAKSLLIHLLRYMRIDFSRFRKLCLSKFSLKNTVISDVERVNSIIFCDKQKNTNRSVKRLVAINTAKMLLESNSKFLINNEELAKAYLFYNVVLESLPLNCRCFDSVKEFKGDIPLVINKLVQYIGICLQDKDINNFDCAQIADLWHGNLFMEVIWSINTVIDRVSIGIKLQTSYNELIKQFNEATGHKLKEFPIFPDQIKEKLNEVNNYVPLDLDIVKIGKTFSSPKITCTKDSQKTLSHEEKNEIEINQVMQPLHDMVKMFCSDIITAYYTSNLSEYFKDINKVNEGYEEKYHWHSFTPISDDVDRIKDSNEELAHAPLWLQLRNKTNYARFMALYGSNLEGKALEHEPIVVSDTKKEACSKKKQKKLGKTTTSKKTLEIIEKNKMNKQRELLELEKQKYEFHKDL